MATHYKSSGIPESAEADLSYARPVGTLVYSGGVLYVSTDADSAAYTAVGGSALSTATTDSAPITNTTAETVFSTGSYSLHANRVIGGSSINVFAAGKVPSTNSTDTLTLRIRIGGVSGTVIAQSPAVDVADDDDFSIVSRITFRTVGASGTLIGSSMGVGPGAISFLGVGWSYVGTEAAVNTTTAQSIVVTAEWSVASTANQVILNQFTVTKG